MFDIKTKVLQKDAFDYLLDMEIKRAMRYQYFFSILIIEPDLMDNISYEAEVIKAIADIVKEEVRNTDTIGRGVDDNFYVILPHAETNNTHLVAERIRSRIENYTFARHNGSHKKTISVGGACFPTHANELKTLVSSATEMINRAKKIGGNSVCLPS